MATIRDARDHDLPAIFEIYDFEVVHGTATFDTQPKAPGERLEWFDASPRDRYRVLVAEEDGGVTGWARLYPWSPRKAYDRTAEDAVYVHRDHRGRGLGRALLAALLEHARRAGLGTIVARIADGNPASLALHASQGFERIGVMRRVGEKLGRILDVHLMQVHLDAPGHGEIHGGPGTGG